MGSSIQTFTQQCTRLSSPLPSWPLQLLTLQLQLTPPPQPMLQLPPTTNPPHTRRRSSPLSHLPTSTELLMTTARQLQEIRDPGRKRCRHRIFRDCSPDGRIQTTTYTADHVNGFVADVTYEGTPVYPPEPKEGYGHAPAYVAPA